jgi:hypothetical protein
MQKGFKGADLATIGLESASTLGRQLRSGSSQKPTNLAVFLMQQGFEGSSLSADFPAAAKLRVCTEVVLLS